MHHSRTARHGPQAITTDDADSSFGCSIAMSGATTQRRRTARRIACSVAHQTAHARNRQRPATGCATMPHMQRTRTARWRWRAHPCPGLTPHRLQSLCTVPHRAAPPRRCMLHCGVLQRCVLHIATVRAAGIGLARRAAQQVRRCGTRPRHGRARGVRGCPNPGSARHGEGRVVRVQVRLLA